jgi:hypothetical protein
MGEGEGSSNQREKDCRARRLREEGRSYQRENDCRTARMREGEGSSNQREKYSTAVLLGTKKEKEETTS